MEFCLKNTSFYLKFSFLYLPFVLMIKPKSLLALMHVWFNISSLLSGLFCRSLAFSEKLTDIYKATWSLNKPAVLHLLLLLLFPVFGQHLYVSLMCYINVLVLIFQLTSQLSDPAELSGAGVKQVECWVAKSWR